MNGFNRYGFNRCAVPGCTNRGDRGHLCGTHRARLARHGDVHHVERDKGGRAGGNKLTVEQCAEIKRLSVGFVSNSEIARRFDVSNVLVRRVLNGSYVPKDAA